MKLLKLNESHLDAVFEIESLTNQSPWSKKDFEKELLNPWFLGCVSENFKGFLLARQVLDELELFLIAVDPKEQSKGYGRKLLVLLLKKAFENEMKYVFLEVRELNEVAINLYESMGFEKIDLRKKYYKNGDNACVMRFVL